MSATETADTPGSVTSVGGPRALPAPLWTGWTPTTHYWTAALLCSALVTLVFVPVYLLEEFGFELRNSPRRMIVNPSEFAMRVVSLSHHAVAAFFLLASLRLRALSTWARLLATSGPSCT